MKILVDMEIILMILDHMVNMRLKGETQVDILKIMIVTLVELVDFIKKF